MASKVPPTPAPPVTAAPVGTQTPTEKTCGVCGNVQPIPYGYDPSVVRCPHMDALWHAAYYESIIRLDQTKAHIDMIIHELTVRAAYLESEKKGIDRTIDAVKVDAAKLADLLG